MIKFINFFFLILLSFACKSKEENLIELIEQRYANLTVNYPEKKMETLGLLKSYFKTNSLSPENLEEINAILHQFSDAHIYLADKQEIKKFSSSIEFFSGTNFIKECLDCLPVLPPNKYQVIEIDGLNIEEWARLNKYLRAASSEHGRSYRLIRELAQSTLPKIKKILVLDSHYKKIETKINWKNDSSKIDNCVSGERISANIFRLVVKNFWCALVGAELSRREVLQRFKEQLDNTSKLIKPNDYIVLDLRDNSGGGDEEVEYLLNSFFEKSIYLYPYQHLLINTPGFLGRAFAFLPFDLHLWGNKIDEFTNISNRPVYHFHQNKVKVLISAGCFSSCEIVTQVFKFEQRAILIGEKTHGGAGCPELFKVKGSEFFVNLPTCLIWQKDGSLFEGVGVSPDMEYISSPSLNGDDLLAKVLQYKS